MHNKLLHHIIQQGTGELFYTFSNADGKIWHMPKNNMTLAMNLYQPSGVKGKLLKNMFPYLFWLKFLRVVLRINSGEYELCDCFTDLLRSVLGDHNFQISIFEGTPSIHQKITIQISVDNRILGYCKISDNGEVKELFRREQLILDKLKDKGVSNVPECLYSGELISGVDIFIQSTIKTQKSKVIHSWEPIHDEFIQTLKERSTQKLIFESTSFYKNLILLKNNIELLSNYNSELISKALDNVLSTNKEKIVDYSIYQGDFTPWNMFVENDDLFVFDWEYAEMTYPPYLDFYHFFTQTAIFEKHWDGDQIFRVYTMLNSDRYGGKQMYVYYLLDIISRFSIRENGNFQKDIFHSMSVWFKLLSLLS